MLQRALVKEGVGERQQQLFRAAGVRHFRQLALRSTWDVAHAVDLSVHEMEVRPSDVLSGIESVANTLEATILIYLHGMCVWFACLWMCGCRFWLRSCRYG